MTLTPTEIPQALAALREALEVGKLYAVRHAHEHESGVVAIRKIDDGREALIELRGLLHEVQGHVQFARDTVASTLPIPSQEYVPVMDRPPSITFESEVVRVLDLALARLDAVLEEGVRVPL